MGGRGETGTYNVGKGGQTCRRVISSEVPSMLKGLPSVGQVYRGLPAVDHLNPAPTAGESVDRLHRRFAFGNQMHQYDCCRLHTSRLVIDWMTRMGCLACCVSTTTGH